MWWPKRKKNSFKYYYPFIASGGGQGTLLEANDIGAKRGLLMPGGVIAKHCTRVLVPYSSAVPRVSSALATVHHPFTPLVT